MYVLADAARAGSALLTLLVDDLDGLLAELDQRGIEAGMVEDIGGGVRQSVIPDPDGNRVKLGQVPA
jgi:hypothetical protein